VQVTGGTPPYTYNWAGTVQGNTATATNLSSGNYSVTVSDANGCTQILPLSVNDVPGINFTTNAQGASCGNANGAASVTASGGTPPYSYAWSNGSSGSLITQIPAGNYSVIISDSLGCEMMAVITVGGSAGPLVNAGEDITIEAGQSVNLDAEIAGVINYSWAPPEGLSCIACPDPVATPDTTTLYIVTVTYNGCIGSDSVLITVDKKCGDIFVPSAFSPNNDGHNDLLYLRGTCIQNMYFKVYDRWGRLMFESTDPSKGWDGNFEGKPCIAGVYHYTAEVTVKGAILVEQGNVTLAR
jgi:gliding motility-associated-like protein